VSGFQVVVLMLLKFCSSVVFCVIVISRVVWFRLCVVLVMLSVRFILNGVVLYCWLSGSELFVDGEEGA